MWEDDFFNKTSKSGKSDKTRDDEREEAVDAEASDAPFTLDRPDLDIKLVNPDLLDDEIDENTGRPVAKKEESAEDSNNEPEVRDITDEDPPNDQDGSDEQSLDVESSAEEEIDETGAMQEMYDALEDHDNRPPVDVLINSDGPDLHDPKEALAELREKTEKHLEEEKPEIAPIEPKDQDPGPPPEISDVEDIEIVSEVESEEVSEDTSEKEEKILQLDHAPSVTTRAEIIPTASSVSELTDKLVELEAEQDEWTVPEIHVDLSKSDDEYEEHGPPQTSYDDSEEDNSFGAESLSDEDSEYAISSSKAVFGGPTSLSLLTNTDDTIDELDPVFGAWQDIQEGQYAFLHTTFRPYPEFKKEANRYVTTLKTGIDPDEHNEQGMVQRVWDYVKWGLQLIWWKGNETSPNLGPDTPPSKPWEAHEGVKPLSAAQMDDETKQTIRDAENKMRNPAHYEVAMYLGVVGKAEDKKELDEIRENAEAGFSGYSTSYQEILFERVNGWDAVTGYMPPEHENRLCMSADELGELIKMPDETAKPQGIEIKKAPFKPLLPARPVPTVEDALHPGNGIIPLGWTRPGTKNAKVVGLPDRDLDHHLVLFGRTGSGKSELLKRLVFGISQSDMPIVILDPHGQLGDDMLHMLVAYSQNRREDIVMMDLGDEEWPIAINPLDIKYRRELEPTVDAIMAMIARALNFDMGNARRAASYIRVALLALSEVNLHLHDSDAKCTLLQVPTFFIDDQFRHFVMEFCTNATVREQFDPEHGTFEKLSETVRLDHLQAVLRPFQDLGARGVFVNTFGSGKNKLDFPSLMRDKKIVIMNMSRFSHQKQLGELVGSLVIPWITSSMESWGRRKNKETGEVIGTGMRLVIDETHTVISNSAKDIEDMLAETRKYDVGLVAATQFPKQLGETREAFFNNTGSKITFVLDPTGVAGFDRSLDAGSGSINAQDIVALPKYVGYCNLLVDRNDTGPFSVAFLRPIDEELNRTENEHRVAVQKVIDQSRAIACNSRTEVSSQILTKKDTIMQALAALVQEKDADDRDDLDLDDDGSSDWTGFSGV